MIKNIFKNEDINTMIDVLYNNWYDEIILCYKKQYGVKYIETMELLTKFYTIARSNYVQCKNK